MADAVVGLLLENVKDLCLYHYKLISSESSVELNLLKDDLEIIKEFLQYSGTEKYDNKLEKQIREAVYEMEDTIDSCVTKAASGLGNLLPRSGWLNNANIDLTKEVRSLRESKVRPLLDAVMIAVGNMNIKGSDNAADAGLQVPKELVRKTSLLREDKVVGFEDEADTIIGYLNEELEEVEVISIIDMPGIGKTTLAWKIYRDPRIRYEFPTLIWVYVSKEFNRKELFLTIMKKFTKQDLSGKDEQELVEILQRYLEGGKFLLFLDNVWTTEAWDRIKPILPKGNGSSKVLITSPNEIVGKHANQNRDPYNLRFLTEEESWKLLQLEIFGDLGECPKILESLGQAIADKCGGVPLAIVVMGGILLKKYSTKGGDMSTAKREWNKVFQSMGSYVNEESTEHIISLSYHSLPYNLRDCFLYLGTFPEAYEIPAWKLIHLWIAEGFVQEDPRKPEQSLEEIAEENLSELIIRNLLMVDKIKANSEIKTCRIHDMIREFCRNEAGYNQQNLFQEMRMSNDFGVFVHPVSEVGKFRRVCVHSYIQDFFMEKPKGPNVRSMLCFSNERCRLSKEHIHTIPNAFPLLRVLDVVPIKFPRFPPKLTQLFHLRYIALFGDDFKVPEAISNLWNVQTIIIETSSSRTLELDVDILNMKQLRHFKSKASIILKTNGKGDPAKHLQTLCRLSPENCTEEVFDRAKDLRVLGIRGKLDSLFDDTMSMENLRHLEKLKLVNDVFPKPSNENPLNGLPQPRKFPPKLKSLTLSSTYLEWKHMSILEKIVTLEVLKLKDNAFQGTLWDADGADTFRSLQFLHIERVDLQCWKISDNGFRNLGCLVLKKCKKLDKVPLGLAKSLKTLEMERVTKSAISSAREIEKIKKEGAIGKKSGGFKLIIAPGDE